MIAASLILIALALVALVYFAVDITLALLRIASALQSGSLKGPRGEAGPQGVPGPRGLTSTVEHPVLDASGARKDLAEVLRREGSSWVHACWVQTDSALYKHYQSEPGKFKLRHHGEEK